MSSDLDGLDTRLGLIADDLEDNRDVLLVNAASLTAMGDRLAGIATGLRGDDVAGSGVDDDLASLQSIVTILALILLAWAALPAAGALLLGWWLRRMTTAFQPHA